MWLLGWISGCVLNYSGAVVLEQPVDRVELRVRRGEVEVRPSEDGTSTVEFSFAGFGEAEVTPIVVDGELRVPDPCGGLDLCSGTVSLEVPPDALIDAVIDEGAFFSFGMSGNVVASVGGRIEVLRHTGAQVDVTSTFGPEIQLSFEAMPERVEARAAEGPLEVRVPPGAYDLDLQATGPISVHPDIEDDPGSRALLRLVAESGAVSVLAD